MPSTIVQNTFRTQVLGGLVCHAVTSVTLGTKNTFTDLDSKNAATLDTKRRTSNNVSVYCKENKMICCSFIFTPGTYNEDFYELDKQIGDFAFALEGFDRVEKWQSADGKTRNVMYFFKDQKAVAQLAQFSEHRTAKNRFAEWYQGYRVDVFELKTSYGKLTENLNTGNDN